YYTLLLTTGFLFASCSYNDNPVPVNEEEIITTINVSMVPNGGGDTITLQSRDLDGDGPNAPVVTISGNFVSNIVYGGAIVLLNETEAPAENITDELEEEDEEHQFFYTVSGGLDATTDYANFDDDGNPLGTLFTLSTGAASTGNLGFTLRHEPTKPNTGLADAGGETDLVVTFSVTID
ncbi:MAG: type 1 periplasmic binding fold superfamily protein, partial [Flavobacteriaceae bacterium]|nr:type 1 periplasmic binding fold superfamily protein [Muriicola sp.]NNL39545.1 type 1 periplasmic binding fold superfamily protein [Flavobacteriaceae bacterium]